MYNYSEKGMKIDKELVQLAIDEIKEKKEKLSMSAVMKTTGYYYADLVAAGYKHLARPYKKTIRPPHKPMPQIDMVDVPHTLEAYTAHIRDNYFTHAETLDQVQQCLVLELSGFQRDTYCLAVNQLILNHELIEQPLRPGHYTAHFAVNQPTAPQPPVKPEPKAVYVVTSGSIVLYEGSSLEKATDTAADQAHRFDKAVHVFKSLKTIRTKIVVIEE